jgi:hydroxymethylpyrimidine kinase/phosphomethylpyrimidine kinase/thiamine-phosphate diphosphorylase
MFKFNDWSKQTETQPHFKPTDLFLYAITDSGMNKRWHRSMYEAVEAAIKGGATMVQLRFVSSCKKNGR